MINTPTVFILGAGASVPYGFPTGKKLKEDICTSFKERYLEKLKASMESDKDDMQKLSERFQYKFKESPNPSVDRFLANNPSLSEYGKFAITMYILEYEERSKSLFGNSSLKTQDKKDQDWYTYIFNRMTEKSMQPDGYKDFGNNNAVFITFNYDRSLEHFFYKSLINTYTECQDRSQIIEELKKIKIYHVYGKIGPLGWEGCGNPIDYGKNLDYDALDFFKDNIKIIYEVQKDTKHLDEIAQEIKDAKKIFFLGFGYLEDNINIIKLIENINMSQSFYGTSVGLFSQEVDRIRWRFHPKLEHFISGMTFEDSDCLTLLRKYL